MIYFLPCGIIGKIERSTVDKTGEVVFGVSNLQQILYKSYKKDNFFCSQLLQPMNYAIFKEHYIVVTVK